MRSNLASRLVLISQLSKAMATIDGDSASLAELCALISAITNLPISQSIALTGSINQHGDVQSIGGVNEKMKASLNYQNAWLNRCKG